MDFFMNDPDVRWVIHELRLLQRKAVAREAVVNYRERATTTLL